MFPAIEIVDLPHRQLVERGDLVLVMQVNGRIFQAFVHDEGVASIHPFRYSSHWSDVGLSVGSKTRRELAAVVALENETTFGIQTGKTEKQRNDDAQVYYLISNQLVEVIRDAQIEAARRSGLSLDELQHTCGRLIFNLGSVDYEISSLSR